MTSTPKQMNGSSANNNGLLGKRKKSRNSKGSYLSKWLDKTMNHIQESTPSMDTYDSVFNSNWPVSNSQFAPGYDPCRFNMYGCTSEPMSLPTLPTYYNSVPPFSSDYQYIQSVNKSIQVQRPRQRRRSENKAVEVEVTPNRTPISTLNSNYMLPKNYADSQDYASLPPLVTSVGDTTSTSDINIHDKDDGVNARRFSDPCVQGLPDVARPANGNGEADSESESGTEASGSQVGNRLLSCLLDQIASLKMTNERINRDLQETKAELNNIRQQNSLWQKGPSVNMGTATLHNSTNGNGLIGSQYSPGFLTDLVREVREAARMREEALYARVRAMVQERNDNGMSSTEAKFNEKSLDEIKNTLRATELDKLRMMDRIMKLEDELRVLRVSNCVDRAEPMGNGISNGNTEDAEEERVRLRKELVDMRKAKQNAEEHALKLERLVTQLRSKFNGVQLSPNGPDSLPSEPEHDSNVRPRRISANSSNNASGANTTVVFGPVTDLWRTKLTYTVGFVATDLFWSLLNYFGLFET